MTFANLKFLTSALLTGDYVLTEDFDEQKMLLSYSYLKIATQADALKLFTVAKGERILRDAQGGLYVRMPELPENDDDELDIDDELCYAAAELIAGMISKKDKRIHDAEASRLIKDYNSKVYIFLDKVALDEYYKESGATDVERFF